MSGQAGRLAPGPVLLPGQGLDRARASGPVPEGGPLAGSAGLRRVVPGPGAEPGLGPIPRGVQAAWLPGGRLHLHQGPIDLVIEAMAEAALPPGEASALVGAAYGRAMRRFGGLLEALVGELAALRSARPMPVRGAVAQAMQAAVAPFRPAFVTPMAAVAGAVADAVLVALVGDGRGLARAYVNNGGDIALWLAEGQSLVAALAGSGDRVVIRQADGVRGLATSGWRGRSHSLGIADAVTALARTAAEADAAATMIANRVDLPGHGAVLRRPACDLRCDSDLGSRQVTVGVGALTGAEVARALDRGVRFAEALRRRGLIAGAALLLQGRRRIVGDAGQAEPPGQAAQLAGSGQPGRSGQTDMSGSGGQPGRSGRARLAARAGPGLHEEENHG